VNDQPPPILRDLIASERAAPGATETAQHVISAKLTTTLGIAPAVAAASVKGALAIKLLSIVIGVAGLTTVAVVATRSDAEPVAPTHAFGSATSAEETSATPIQVSEPDVVAAKALDEPRRQLESRRAVPTAPVSAAPDVPQSTLLANASRALYGGDAARALVMLDDDARAHPDGALAEEREALRLSALLALSRTREARALAEKFLAQFPHTVHRAVVDRALSSEQTP
jgi:hypothetical protein